MIVKTEDAKNYQCCKFDKPCEGNKCMAWNPYYEIINRKLPHGPSLEITDMGYCGIINNSLKK